jgi:putative DNA primase/helicase
MDNEKIEKIEALLDAVDSQNVQPDGVDNLPQYTFTELGNAKRFVAIASDEFKWVPELKEWVHWTGKKWEVDTHAKIIRRYEDVLESLKQEMKPLGEELKEIAATPNAGIKDTTEYNRVKSIKQELKSISDWYTRSQFEKTIKSSLNLVRAQEGMTIAYSQFDSKGHFLGVSNGIVNLKTGELITRKSDYLVTKTAAVNYEPNNGLYPDFPTNELH